jgi:hypothetical protein
LRETAIDEQFGSGDVAGTSSEAKNTAAAAISSAVPRRPSGVTVAIILRRCSPAGDEASSPFKPGVSIRFGLLANLTQFPSATSRKDDSSEVASQPKSRGLPDTRACACDDRDRFRHIFLVRF